MKSVTEFIFLIWGLLAFICFLLAPIITVGMLVMFLVG